MTRQINKLLVIAPPHIIKECLKNKIIDKEDLKMIEANRKQLADILGLTEEQYYLLDHNELAEELSILNSLLDRQTLLAGINHQKAISNLVDEKDQEEIKRLTHVINTLKEK